jgi:hypothetical protein
MKELLEIQTRLVVGKNQRNNFGKYNFRNAEDIMEGVKPLLKELGVTLHIQDTTVEVGGIPCVQSEVFLMSIDGKVRSESSFGLAGIDPNRKGMDIAQSFGSSLSYSRKYALQALFLLDDNKDPDATNTHGKSAPAQSAPKVQTGPDKTVTAFVKKLGEDKLKEMLKTNELEALRNGKYNGKNEELMKLRHDLECRCQELLDNSSKEGK